MAVIECKRRKIQIDGLVQERRNSSALAMELRHSCTNPSKCRRLLTLLNLKYIWLTLVKSPKISGRTQ